MQLSLITGPSKPKFKVNRSQQAKRKKEERAHWSLSEWLFITVEAVVPLYNILWKNTREYFCVAIVQNHRCVVAV